MKKYKVYYERMFEDQNLDSVASTQSIEVEAENESEAYEIAEEKIYSNSHTENFDDLNLLNCVKIIPNPFETLTKEEFASSLLSKKELLVKENFFELGLVGQGFIVDEYLRKIDYDDLQEVLSIIAEREIKEGNSRHDFMEAASSAYSDLKDDDE